MGENRRHSGRRARPVMVSMLAALFGCQTESKKPDALGELGLRARSAALAEITTSPPAACPGGMLLVEGDFCPEVRQVCKRWLDPPGPYHHFRCAEYEEPAQCLAERTRMRFCIDRDEYEKPGETLPANHQSLSLANATCRAEGKRVCSEREWVFACEGEKMRPYPYGFRRDSSVCNADRQMIVDREGKLVDLRAQAEVFPRCESPFGVRHQAGNLEEVVAIDGSRPIRAALKGAFWQPGRSTCRATQTAHDAYYHGTETGFRCCADAVE